MPVCMCWEPLAARDEWPFFGDLGTATARFWAPLTNDHDSSMRKEATDGMITYQSGLPSQGSGFS